MATQDAEEPTQLQILVLEQVERVGQSPSIASPLPRPSYTRFDLLGWGRLDSCHRQRLSALVTRSPSTHESATAEHDQPGADGIASLVGEESKVRRRHHEVHIAVIDDGPDQEPKGEPSAANHEQGSGHGQCQTTSVDRSAASRANDEKPEEDSGGARDQGQHAVSEAPMPRPASVPAEAEGRPQVGDKATPHGHGYCNDTRGYGATTTEAHSGRKVFLPRGGRSKAPKRSLFSMVLVVMHFFQWCL